MSEITPDSILTDYIDSQEQQGEYLIWYRWQYPGGSETWCKWNCSPELHSEQEQLKLTLQQNCHRVYKTVREAWRFLTLEIKQQGHSISFEHVPTGQSGFAARTCPGEFGCEFVVCAATLNPNTFRHTNKIETPF